MGQALRFHEEVARVCHDARFIARELIPHHHQVLDGIDARAQVILALGGGRLGEGRHQHWVSVIRATITHPALLLW